MVTQDQATPAAVAKTGPALVISELAAGKLAAVMQERGLAEYGLRVFVQGMGCSGLQYGMVFENAPEATDITIESNGITLYLDQASSEYMWGSHIDFVEAPQGGAFSIHNPNSFSCCGSNSTGCGSSPSGCGGSQSSGCGG